MNKSKKIILIICGLFIVLSGILYLGSDSIGKYISEKNAVNNEFVSSIQSYDTAENDKLQTSSKNIKSDSENSKVVVYRHMMITTHLCGQEAI